MGTPRAADDVCLISAVCYNSRIAAQDVLRDMSRIWGPVELKSSERLFSHTSYYEKEMGKKLLKFYISFERYIEPMAIVPIKQQSNELERTYSVNGKRLINIDPGYIEAPKLVLATTKNFSHRIYLGQGIYGDVQLVWRGGRFQGNPWTYPDYLETETLEFFTAVRNQYMNKGAKSFVSQL